MPFPLDERFLIAAETSLGVRFPEPYRARLLAQNGGDVELGADESFTLHPVRDDSDGKRTRRTWDDVVRQTQLARAWPGFPPDAIAIGDDGCGNALVLLPRASSTEFAIAVWDHERRVATPLDGGFAAVAW